MTERFTDDMAPREVAKAPGYSRTAAGPVRRAPLRSASGALLGHVWTDDREAAGWSPDEAAGAAGVRAGTFVWRVLSIAHQRGRPARSVLDPAPFTPLYNLGAPEAPTG